jgi:hypothetical protein
MRPCALAEVAELTARGESFDFALRNFLDEFSLHPAATALNAEPRCLQDHRDAYLAATAESLATQHGFPVPAWAWSESRKLRRPWFALPWAGMRAVLLLESPAAFRSRNLFVSANALSRV